MRTPEGNSLAREPPALKSVKPNVVAVVAGCSLFIVIMEIEPSASLILVAEFFKG
jgi:hypothetical protein